MTTQNLRYGNLTHHIIGCAMKIHRYFGSGFPEIIYHRALMIELRNSGVSFHSEVEKIVMYFDEQVGKRRVDLIVEESVLVELKAISELDPLTTNQVINCLKVFNLKVGLLLNFGKASLEYKRFVN